MLIEYNHRHTHTLTGTQALTYCEGHALFHQEVIIIGCTNKRKINTLKWHQHDILHHDDMKG